MGLPPLSCRGGNNNVVFSLSSSPAKWKRIMRGWPVPLYSQRPCQSHSIDVLPKQTFPPHSYIMAGEWCCKSVLVYFQTVHFAPPSSAQQGSHLCDPWRHARLIFTNKDNRYCQPCTRTKTDGPAGHWQWSTRYKPHVNTNT